MFEEVEARAYHILDEKIKSYIIALTEISREYRKQSDMARNNWSVGVREYFDGQANTANFIIKDLNAIINSVESDSKKALDIEYHKFAEYLESEIVTDSARSKQS